MRDALRAQRRPRRLVARDAEALVDPGTNDACTDGTGANRPTKAFAKKVGDQVESSSFSITFPSGAWLPRELVLPSYSSDHAGPFEYMTQVGFRPRPRGHQRGSRAPPERRRLPIIYISIGADTQSHRDERRLAPRKP